MCLHRFELTSIEVAGIIELCDFGFESSQSLSQILRRCLAADRYWTDVVERVVVDSETLPQAAVDETFLKTGARVVEHIRENVGCVGRPGIFSYAWTLPL